MSLLKICSETYYHKHTATGSIILAILYGCSHMEYSDILRKLIKVLDLISLLIVSGIAF